MSLESQVTMPKLELFDKIIIKTEHRYSGLREISEDQKSVYYDNQHQLEIKIEEVKCKIEDDPKYNLSENDNSKNLQSGDDTRSLNMEVDFDTNISPVIEDYECYLCGDKFNTRALVEAHEGSHKSTEGSKDECLRYDKICIDKNAPDEHNEKDSPELKNTQCHSPAPDYEKFKSDPERLDCPLCEDHFFEREEYIAHIHIHLNTEKFDTYKIKYFTCDICNAQFKKKSLLLQHKSSHERPKYKCSICEKSFLSKTVASTHEEKHALMAKRKRYTCQLCHKNYLDNRSFNNHKKTHLPESERLKCPLCEKTFAYSELLRCHKKIHLPDNERKKYKCSHCKREYMSSKSIRRHKCLYAKADTQG